MAMTCKNCGGTVSYKNNTLVCEFCGAAQSLSDLFSRADEECILDRDPETAATLNTYCEALSMMERAQTHKAFTIAAELFEEIPSAFNAEYLAKECRAQAELVRKEQIYQNALLSMDMLLPDKLEQAIALFESIADYKDSAARIDRCRRLMPQAQQRTEQARREEQRREAARKRAARRNKIRAAFIAGIGSLLFLCFIIFYASLHSRMNFKIRIEPKDEAYLTTDYNKYTFHYNVTIKNNGFIDITALKADIYFEDDDGNVLIDTNLNLYNYSTPVVRAKKSTNLTWSVTTKSEDTALALYNSDFEDLDIHIKITDITFKNGKRKQY